MERGSVAGEPVEHRCLALTSETWQHIETLAGAWGLDGADVVEHAVLQLLPSMPPPPPPPGRGGVRPSRLRTLGAETSGKQTKRQESGWATLDEGILSLIVARLHMHRSDAASKRLVCHRWAAELPRGVWKLDVKGEGPAGWGRRLFSGLEELRWTDPSQIAEAGELTKLRALRLKRCFDMDLEILSSKSSALPASLELLDLDGCENITEEGMKGLKLFVSLTSLNLRNCNNGVSDAVLKELRHLSALSSLDLGCCHNVTDTGLAELISCLSSLSSLSLKGSSITDQGLKDLCHLSALSPLGCWSISDEKGPKGLRHLSAFSSLDLMGCLNITDAGLKELSGLSNLSALNLSGCINITDAGFQELLWHFSALTSLNLMQCQIFRSGLKELRHLTSLSSLNLSWCGHVADEDLRELRHLSALSSLSLRGCQNMGHGFKELSSLSIVSLDLSRSTGIKVEGLKHLSALSTLTLQYCSHITDSGLQELKFISSLTSLDLQGCIEITDNGLLELSFMQATSSSLSSLNLTDCRNITEIGVKGLRQMLPSLNIKR